MPNFYDPRQLQIQDPGMPVLPEQPKKSQGFWDRVVASSGPGKVLGMPADEFAMMMGRYASSMLPPNSPYARFANAVGEQGAMTREQRLKEAAPEYRLAAAKANALLGSPDAAQSVIQGAQQQSISGVAPGPVTDQARQMTLSQPQNDPMAIFRQIGLAEEMSRGPLANQLTQQQIQELQASTTGRQVDTERTRTLTPLEAEKLKAEGATAGSQARVATATEGQRIAASEAELQKLRAETELTQKQNKYYETTQVALPKAQLGISQQNANIAGGHLALGRERMKEDIITRRLAQVTSLSNGLSNHMATVNDHTNKLLANTPPTQQYGVYAQAGKSLISQGLHHIDSIRPFGDVDRGAAKTVGAQALSSGITYYVQGVNSAANIQAKIGLTQDLIRQIDLIKQFQPEMGAQLEYQIFGGASPIGGKTTGRNYGLWNTKQTFDPMVVWKAMRGKK